ncbi:hypothetical protein JOF53_001321 [Crossiella equi]|uniref:Pectate lyase superfamily protein n=1 Tax=Crossiella equi TaxID=130796 RepID=A0ABS5A895_9PSEU|nr:hypothetical protein [Crossiella equi]MBP2472449.1 hypothetical protein [Crossiella equi]
MHDTFDRPSRRTEGARVVDIGRYGADREGGGDPVANTALAQRALDDLTDNSVLLIPAGVYLLAPGPGTAAGEPVLELPRLRNLIVRGDGPASVLRVAGRTDAGPRLYGTVLGFKAGPRVPDLVYFTEFTVDHNCTENPLPVKHGGSFVLGSTISTYARVPVFGRVTVRDVIVHRSDARVSLYFPGGSATDGHVTVQDCTWSEASHRTGEALDDQSFVNATCASLTVRHNRFHGVSWARAPRTAIETHASNTLVQGNLVERFQIGVNLTGNTRHGGTTFRHLCQDNLIEASRDGILIWSHRYADGAATIGFEDLVVSGNHVTLHPGRYTSPPFDGKGLRGIGVFAVKSEPTAPSTGFRNLLIADNTIRYPLESAAPDYIRLTDLNRKAGAISFAFSDTTADDDTYENVRITGNVVHDCAFSGLFVEGGSWRGLQVDGNTFVDCAHSASGKRVPEHSNVVVWLKVRLLGDCVVTGNTAHTTTRPAGERTWTTAYLHAEHTGPDRHRFLVSANTFALEPAIRHTPRLAAYVEFAGAGTLWTLDGAVPRAGIPITTNAPGGIGSRVRVDQSEVLATRTATGWQQQGFGTRAPAGAGFAAGDVWVNTAVSEAEPVHSWVCVGGGEKPVWREVRAS